MAENKHMIIDKENFPYVFIKNIDIPLKTYEKDGKDVPYGETPDPGYWTRKGYIVVRADERGAGQSPGFLDTVSRGTSEAFFDVIELAVEQEWSSGKVGLLGISYYAGTQWQVAARKPKGLAAIIPWEDMSDYYRDRVRHGGILSDRFIDFWWNNVVSPNQYGKPGRATRKWGDDTLEGDLNEDTLLENRRDQTINTAMHKFRDEEYYRSRDFDVEAIEIPLLSVANWGGILLHLRGNALGWIRASSKYKFLHFIVGRHDLPFYYPESAELQLSFFNSFLKDDDAGGWKSGNQPRTDWPLPGTEYTKFFLTPENTLSTTSTSSTKMVEYDALHGKPIIFKYKTSSSLEITGHITAHLTVSATRESNDAPVPTDIDLFITLRKMNSKGEEVFYTGTMCDPVPIVKGWQRVSLRKVDATNKLHEEYLPYRKYYSTDAQAVEENQQYEVGVEVWPTNVVLDPEETLVLEIAGHDTQGVGKFSHEHADDRDPKVFGGKNCVTVGGGASWLTLPIINSGKQMD
ncbi:putative acyl esterase [Fusarium longipes]|uniref:Putative acyl esterase n=1 Tax=Fusarium longipes TaxID=694270 RepID=A0A395SJS2_9HYPO|nr:putative acyl esterase [Fusarium longipes]